LFISHKPTIFAPKPKNGMDIEDIAKFTNMDITDISHILEQ